MNPDGFAADLARKPDVLGRLADTLDGENPWAAVLPDGVQRVVLLGIPRPSAIGAATGRLHAAEVYADVAKRSRSMIVHDAVADVLSDAGLRLDPLHPNEEGHRRLAETIERAFRTSGLLR